MKNYAKLILTACVVGTGLTVSGIGAAAEPAESSGVPASPHMLSANIGLFTQYIFRGLTQTNEKPALQGGVDYAHASGFYLGFWGSNITWVTDGFPNTSAGLEADIYLGIKHPIGASGLSYDLGFLRYNYPGSFRALPPSVAKPDTNELYAGLGYRWVTLKYSYSLGDTFMVRDARGTTYVDLSASFELPYKLNLALHLGHQRYEGINSQFWGASGLTNDALSYTDYRIAISKEINGYVLGMALTGTDARSSGGIGNVPIYENAFGKNVGRTQAVVSVSRAF